MSSHIVSRPSFIFMCVRYVIHTLEQLSVLINLAAHKHGVHFLFAYRPRIASFCGHTLITVRVIFHAASYCNLRTSNLRSTKKCASRMGFSASSKLVYSMRIHVNITYIMYRYTPVIA